MIGKLVGITARNSIADKSIRPDEQVRDDESSSVFRYHEAGSRKSHHSSMKSNVFVRDESSLVNKGKKGKKKKKKTVKLIKHERASSNLTSGKRNQQQINNNDIDQLLSS